MPAAEPPGSSPPFTPAPIWRHPAFQQGARDMAPAALGIGAWGMVTGMAMVKMGLAPWAAVLITLTVYAGSSQLAAVPLLVAGAPLWVVWATAFCVNLRFVIFSATWRYYFGGLPRARRMLLGYLAGDLNVVLFMRRFPQPEPHPDQWPYFWGGAAVNWTSWQLMSMLGIALATSIPSHWGLGFAGTLALLGITGSLMVDKATWVAAGVAATAAVAAFALPFKLNIVVAIVSAVAVGVLLDHYGVGRAPRAAAKPVGKEAS